MNSKISIIMPVYNTEKYLKKSIESILNQTYQNIELIIIDDCSTDNSKNIIINYKTSHNNIIIIENKKHHGAGFCRNQGIKKATGEYIGFIDSDDFIPTDYYEILLKKCLQNQADITICDIKTIYEDAGCSNLSPACNGIPNKINVINNSLAASSCNKIFKKKIIEQFPYPENIINEDLATIIPSILYANKISYTTETYYNYIQHQNSVQNTLTNSKFDIFKSLEITLNRIKKCNNYEIYKDILIFNQIILMLFFLIPNELNFKKRYKLLKKFHYYSKPYSLIKNNNLRTFLSQQGKYHYIYYKSLIYLNHYNLPLLNNLLILITKIYISKRKSVIKSSIKIDDLLYLAKKQSKKKNNISISVIIPNYNYAKFLYQRFYSVLSQTEKLSEIIILDDYSTDNSRDIIDEICEKIINFVPIRKIYNNKNSGIAFKQWSKGLEYAKSDYIWIAEADDYCSKNFLKQVLKPIKKEKDIVISYSDTSFINQDGNIILKSVKKQIDLLNTNHWNHNYINDGTKEVNNYSYLNCTIANVSSIIFKNGDYHDIFQKACDYHQAGDWYFYVNLMIKGKIAYTKKRLNFYRIHGNNITSTTSKRKHMDEILKMYQYLEKNFDLTNYQKVRMKERLDFLKKAWNLD